MDIRNEFDLFEGRVLGVSHGAAVAADALAPFELLETVHPVLAVLRGLAGDESGAGVLAEAPWALRAAARTAQLALVMGCSQDLEGVRWAAGVENSIEEIRLNGEGFLADALRLLRPIAGCSWLQDDGDEIPQPIEFP